MDRIKTNTILVIVTILMLGALIYANRDKFSSKNESEINV